MAAIRPIITTSFVSESEFHVVVELDHLIPVKSTGDTKEAKNGTVDIEFFKQSMNLIAKVKESKVKTQHYKLNIVRFPSQIDVGRCDWKLLKDKAYITLIKREDGPGDTPCNWKSIVTFRGLDQYDSSEDEDGEVPNPVPFTFQSDRLEEMGLDVERGKDQTFYVSAEDREKLKF